jgi:hypothetical protein
MRLLEFNGVFMGVVLFSKELLLLFWFVSKDNLCLQPVFVWFGFLFT